MANRLFEFGKLLSFESTLLRDSVRKKPGRRWCSKYFLTTPLFYVNAEPHIGHLYTALIGDAAVRFQKLKNPNLKTKFLVGTDEHGLKVHKSAQQLKKDVKSFCDEISNKYRSLFDLFNVEADDFFRTTEERHFKTVTALWNKIYSKDLIYKEKYSGWYCIPDEMFVSKYSLAPLPPKGDQSKVRYTKEDYKPVQFVSEENYKFQLSKFREDILHWLKGEVIKPKKFQDLVCQWMENEEMMQDISVSRPAERVPWGIPVPGDESQNIYVWMDALASYLTTNGYPDSSFKWPPDLQIIGKDILKFHGIYWPAFLMAADLEPPRSILCHSHWLIYGQKLSKSKGNVIDPFEQEKIYTSDGFRYFLLSEGVAHSDGDFNHMRASDVLDSHLADSLGNLLNRCTALAINPEQCFPPLLKENHKKYCVGTASNLVKCLEELPELVERNFEECNFHRGILFILNAIHMTNKYFDSESPWKLRKNPNKQCRLNYVLHLSMESLRVFGILLQPIVPNISCCLLDKLSVDREKRNWKDIRPFSWESTEGFPGHSLMKEKVNLFPKLVQYDMKRNVDC